MREARDPYSTGAYASSLASQFVNLDDAELKPDGWDGHAVPEVAGPEHAVIYEGHIRDFSIRDESTPEAHRGKYLAFTAADSAPVRHLRSLADAGLTHFHVLPAFDIRSVNEDPAQQVNLNNAIYELCRLDDSNEELCPGDEFDRTPLIERLRALDPRYPGGPRSGGRHRRSRRLQLGLRPRALQRPRGQLRHGSRRRRPHPRNARHVPGAARNGPARGHGRGLQPHLRRRRRRRLLGVRPHRPRLLLPAQSHHRRRRAGKLLQRHRRRERHDGQVHQGLDGILGQTLQGGRLPFRLDEPALRRD